MQAPQSIARLVAEAGFAAVNHGLRAEMRDILSALPDWIDEPVQLARIEAIVLLGLGQRRAAARRLAAVDAGDVGVLSALLTQDSPELRT
ncbi:MAG: EscG/YscG/SsaH family type III secretion system needle protein co-chaperone [Burkholderiaceae bacterium]|nr:EscG/YscG/SsaH family type III secretion system needle protein co-chaperone [Burkholderiaceae bacterium]